MDHVKAIATKFVATLAVLYIILGLYYGMTFGYVLLITLVLGTISYFVGDLGILPRTNNAIATLADFGLALATIWIMVSLFTGSTNAFTMALIPAIAVTIFEYLFHNYMLNIMNGKGKEELDPRANSLQYQTEVSDEIYPHVDKNDGNKNS